MIGHNVLFAGVLAFFPHLLKGLHVFVALRL